MSSSYQGVAPILFESVSAVTATPSVQLGSRVIVDGNEYVYCYNASTSGQASKGYCVTVSGVSGYSVTVSSTTNVDLPFGLVKHATIAVGSYGWIMVRGFCAAAKAASAVAVGDMLAHGVDGNLVAVATMVGQFGPVVGKAMAAAVSATSGTADVYVRCFG